MQFKRKDFIWIQRGAREKAVKEGIAQGLQQGIEQGVAQGIEREKMETARNMLRDNLPVDMICKYTGLGKETVEQLLHGD